MNVYVYGAGEGGEKYFGGLKFCHLKTIKYIIDDDVIE